MVFSRKQEILLSLPEVGGDSIGKPLMYNPEGTGLLLVLQAKKLPVLPS